MPGPNFPYSKLDYQQVIKQSFDETKDRLRVDATLTFDGGGGSEIVISDTDDSIKVGDGSGVYLDINPDGSINAEVTAVDLDIRDLSHTQDSIKIGDGVDFLAINSDGSTNVRFKDSSGNDFGTTSNPIQVALPASTSTGNSTTTPLGSGATFTGDWIDIFGVSTITAMVFADQDSATQGLKYEFSSDGINIDDDNKYSIFANAGKQHSLGATTRYFRVRYTNGITAQSVFRLQINLHYVPIKPSTHRVGDDIVDDDDAELIKSVLTCKSPSGDYQNVRVSDLGYLLTESITGFNSALVHGEVTLTVASVQGDVMKTAYTEQSTNAQRSISSSNANDTGAGTGARTVEITYFDQTYSGPFTEIITLNGLTAVATTNSDICFIDKIEVLSVGSTGSNVGIITLHQTAGGVGTIGTIAATDNETKWCHKYVGTNVTYKITGLYCSSNATTTAQNADFRILFKSNVANSPQKQVSDLFRLFGQASTTERPYRSPIEVNGPGRLKVTALPATGATIIYRAAIDFYEVD